ncbi:MAG: hypothetical protein NWE81_04215 [Candidatus Bathyarchaeota archaeon]|nr:hypothetical protein [Candidatus Bathyarchaeota archaeon]
MSATYYISVVKIQARGKLLNLAVAKQNMLSFEDAIDFTKWSPGTSNIYYFEDSGGAFKTQPTGRRLVVNVTDGAGLHSVAFNNSVGKVVYELPAAETVVYTHYLKGDKRAIVNQSAFTMTQLYVSPGSPSPEMTLTYRPLATVSETGFDEGKPVNTVRLYIVSLHLSNTFTAQGAFNIKATCVNVTSSLQNHNLTSPITSIRVTAILDGNRDTVILPVSSNAAGVFVKLEVLVCYVKIERAAGGR